MSTRLSSCDLVRLARGAAENIRSNHQRLSELDSVFGDGDHGTTMLRVVDRLQASVKSSENVTPRLLLQKAGWEILACDGGASTSLLGSFTLGMADALPDREYTDCREIAMAIKAGLCRVSQHTKAKLGDKTLLDALVPAITAFAESAHQGHGLSESLRDAARAAQAGAEATIGRTMRHGRGRTLGEKTRGHQDAGATTVALLFAGFCSGFTLA